MQLCAGTRHREIQRLLVIAKKSRAVLMRRGPDTSGSGCPVQIGEQFSPALNQVNCGKMPRRYLSPNDSIEKSSPSPRIARPKPLRRRPRERSILQPPCPKWRFLSLHARRGLSPACGTRCNS
jgi:hypothetical protein